MYSYIDAPNTQQLTRLGAIDAQCFAYPRAKWQSYLERIGQDNFRLIVQEDRAIAGLALCNLGQWLGGQAVPMTGIASVAVAPEYRGRGIANLLLTETIQELHSRRIPLSALYPATQVPYRQVGYEQGGSFCHWKLPTADIQIQERDLAITPIKLSDCQVVADIYSQQAQLNNGNLARDRTIWQSVLEPSEPEELYAYLIGSHTQPEGYLIFTQKQEQIQIRDWALLTATAARRLWTFLKDHRSQIKEVTWWGSPLNPFLLLLPEQTATMVKQKNWMLRIIDLESALTQRGYSPELTAELHLELQDDLLPANNGKFCLQVSQGKGAVNQGGNGDFKINIRHFASLYTGFLSPLQLKQLNYLQTTSAALVTASLIFSGDRPWMADFF